MTDIPQDLYERIRDEPSLKRLVDDEGEHLHLEFKEVRIPEKPLTKKDWERIAKEMSAFANAVGGVVVAGVRDDPHDLLPISGLAAADRYAAEQVGNLLAPPHPGVRMKAIATQADTDRGYLVFLVPQSDTGPT